MFRMVHEDEILRIDNKRAVYYRDKKLDMAETQKLKSDAETFADSTLWKALTDEGRYRANLRMFDEAQSIDDLIVGKVMLYVIDIFESKIKRLRNL